MSTAKIAKPPKIIRKSFPTARSRPYCAIFLVLREKVCDIVIASRTYCHPELVEGSRGNETSLYVCHFTSFRSREIATLTLAMTTGFCDKTRAELANLCDKTRAERATPSRQSAELWHEHLSVYGLIAKIFCAVSNAISQVWLTLLRQTRNIVATTMTFA